MGSVTAESCALNLFVVFGWMSMKALYLVAFFLACRPILSLLSERNEWSSGDLLIWSQCERTVRPHFITQMDLKKKKK